MLRSDEYVNLPGCLDGVDIPKDQLNTVIHEVMHMILGLHVSDEAKVVTISEAIQPRRRAGNDRKAEDRMPQRNRIENRLCDHYFGG